MGESNGGVWGVSGKEWRVERGEGRGVEIKGRMGRGEEVRRRG